MKFQSYRSLFLCLIGLLLAFTASLLGHLPDLSFVIVGIVSAFITGQSADRGTAFFAASKDPNCNTESVIHATLGNPSKSESITITDLFADVKKVFLEIEEYVAGSEKPEDDEESE